MAYFKRLNNAMAAASFGGPNGPWIQTWHTFLNDLIARGWRVLGSGDTYTYENTGQTAGSTGTGPGGGYDVITSAAGGEHNGGGGSDTRVVGGLGNCYGFPYTDGLAGASWRRIATPVGATHYREYLFTHQWKFNQNTSRHIVNVYLARDATTFNALGTAQRPPLPVDSSLYVCLAGNQNPFHSGTGSSATPAGAAFGPGAAGYAHWFIGDSSQDFDFLFWTTRSTEQSIFRMFGQLRLTRTLADQIGEVDKDPYLYISTGSSSDSGSIDVGRGTNYFFRVANPNNFDPTARVESRSTTNQQYGEQGALEGLFISYGLYESGDAPFAGTYSGAVWFNTPVGSSSPADPTSVMGGATVDGKSLVMFNPMVGRATNEAIGGPEFFKGYIKGDLLAITTRFDDPTQLEDETGPNGSSTGRRLSAGYLHLLWEDNTAYLE